MPYNLTPSKIGQVVLPQMLCRSFTETYIYPLLSVEYNDGTLERSLITDATSPPPALPTNNPRYLRTFILNSMLTTAQLNSLLNFWEQVTQGGLIPFWFYNPHDVCPIGSNWDSTGTNTDGRLACFFRGDWAQRTPVGGVGLDNTRSARHQGPNLTLIETWGS